VDDASSWFPEADAVFIGNRRKEVEYFVVLIEGVL
jgi:hypothetical protein